MSTATALILLFLALSLAISAGVAAPRRDRPGGRERPEADGQVESELLRRPLRSRRPA